MIENEKIKLEIESMSNLGYGIAHFDGMVIFVENACPKDKVEAKITKVKKSYANATVTQIIEPSPHRIQSFCALQKVCGACQMQFIDYDYQLQLKREFVEDAMHSIGNIEVKVNNVIRSPEIKGYRHKIQYPVSQTAVSERILAGYYKGCTHEVVNIKHCPIQPEICDEIIEFIREQAKELKITGYNEKKHTGDLRHVIIRVSKSNGKILVVLVINLKNVYDRINVLAKNLMNKFKAISGICVNFNTQQTNVILGKESKCVAGQDFIEEKIGENIFKIGANTFFQINPKSAENIFFYIKNYIKENYKEPTILDAYAGIAAIGITVSDISKSVTSVELSEEACKKAQDCLKINKVNNLEITNSDTLKYLKSIKRKFDIIITDP